METIAIASSKGGSGKTTVALNLAVALAERNWKTLLIDLDPQGAVGLSLARPDVEWAGMVEHMMGQVGLDDALLETRLPGLWLLPRGRLDPADACEFEQALWGSSFLGELGQEVHHREFDYVLLDTPSGLGMITRAALTTSRWVLMPLQAETLSLRAAGQCLRVIERVQEEANPEVHLLGILPTMVALDDSASLEVMRALWAGFSAVMDTYVPRSEVFGHASQAGVPVSFLGGRERAEAHRFAALAAEVEDTIARNGQQPGEDHDRPQRALV